MTGPDTMTPFEERLLSQLQEYREQLPEPPPARAAEQWIIPTRRLVLVGAIIAVIAVAGGTAVLVGRSHSKAAAPRSVTQIKQRMLEAISASNGQILHEVVKGSGSGHVESWQDLETGKYSTIAYTTSGQPLTATFASDAGGVFRVDFVDYQDRTWHTVSAPTHLSHAQPGGTQQLEDLYRNLVTRGYFKLAGTGKIDGTRVIDLHGKIQPPAGFPIDPTTIDLWVDASTYLPVRQVQTRDSAVVGTTDYSLLPRSKANLAKFDFVAPAGFTHTQGTGTFSNGSSSGTFSSGSTTLGGTTTTIPAAATAPAAAASSGDRIVHWTSATLAPGASTIRRADIWSDMATGAVHEVDYDQSGKAVRESASTVAGNTIRVETVDYTDRTWNTEIRTYPNRVVMPTGIAVGAAPSPHGMTSIGAGNRFSFERNGATLVGRETIDGVPAVHYRSQVPSANGTVTEDVWFDASTYVPLRSMASQGSKVLSRETWQWLIPTEAGREKTEFLAPTGFAHTTTRTSE